MTHRDPYETWLEAQRARDVSLAADWIPTLASRVGRPPRRRVPTWAWAAAGVVVVARAAAAVLVLVVG